MDYKSLNLPSEDEMQQYLIDRNIGYDFKTNKSKIPKLKKDKLEKCYKICVIGNNYGDISKIKYENIKDFDLFNFSFPCTDISIAGKQKGMTDINGNKTSSGLYINGIELIKVKKPKYIMIENVKNLISKKFINDFNSLINELKALGYKCYYPTKNGKPKCLNAKDYGIPQNRERIFIICVRNDIKLNFEFPKEFDNGLRLKDLLEDEVDKKYYINTERASVLIDKLMEAGYLKGNITPCDSTIMKPKSLEVANCITARYDAGIQNKQSIGVAVVEKTNVGVIGSTQKNAYVGNGKLCSTLTSAMGQGGGHIPMVASRIGGLFDDEKGKHQAGSV